MLLILKTKGWSLDCLMVIEGCHFSWHPHHIASETTNSFLLMKYSRQYLAVWCKTGVHINPRTSAVAFKCTCTKRNATCPRFFTIIHKNWAFASRIERLTTKRNEHAICIRTPKYGKPFLSEHSFRRRISIQQKIWPMTVFLAMEIHTVVHSDITWSSCRLKSHKSTVCSCRLTSKKTSKPALLTMWKESIGHHLIPL